MTFEELFDALRSLAEENAANGRPSSNMTFNPFASGEALYNQKALQTWTLQPDHIDVLVQGLQTLREHNLLLIALLEPISGKNVPEKVKTLLKQYEELKSLATAQNRRIIELEKQTKRKIK